MMTDENEAEFRAEIKAKQKLIADQREANEKMVQATISAEELTEKAEIAQARAEAIAGALRESEENYRTLFEVCPVAVYACDAAGVIQRYNHHAVELWGRTPALGDTDERFCGSHSLFRLDGSHLPHAECPMAEVVSGKVPEVQDAEVLIERPDGSRITVVVNIRPLKDASGRVTGAINCFYDISRRKEAERDMNDSLERERVHAEFRETFIGIVGHDLRNPLASIVMAAASMLRRGRLDDLDADMASRVIRSSQRMTRMTAQLLDLTRARLGGGLPIEPKPTDLREICRHIVEEFASAIELQSDGDLSGIWDEDRLEEALSNIVGNALQYATPGTAVSVKARADGSDVVVEIMNRGEPIPAEVLPLIFEPFRRGPGHAKTAGGSLGLGLYIADQIVAAHGGTLTVRCDQGATTFVMRLPRRPATGGPARRSTTPR